MHPMYSQLSLKIPRLGLRTCRIGFRGPGIVVTGAPEASNVASPRMVAGSGVTPESPPTVIKFQANLQGSASHENLPQSHPESWKMDPKIMSITNSGKVGFAIPLMPNAWLSHPNHPDSDAKNIRKRNLETSITNTTSLIQGIQKAFKWGPQTQ